MSLTKGHFLRWNLSLITVNPDTILIYQGMEYLLTGLLSKANTIELLVKDIPIFLKQKDATYLLPCSIVGRDIHQFC